MSSYALTVLAKADIFDIWSRIADDDEMAADRVEHAIYEACAFVADAPLRGHSRRDLTDRPLRFWPSPDIRTTRLSTGQRRSHWRSSPFCTGKGMSGGC